MRSDLLDEDFGKGRSRADRYRLLGKPGYLSQASADIAVAGIISTKHMDRAWSGELAEAVKMGAWLLRHDKGGMWRPELVSGV
jgi:hypothetical protein